MVIEADEVAREALRLVSKMFPPAMSWAPESPGATFPADYSAAGLPVVSSELMLSTQCLWMIMKISCDSRNRTPLQAALASPSDTSELWARGIDEYVYY